MNMSFDEFRQSYVVHKMGEQETVNAFDCGDEDLNGFIGSVDIFRGKPQY